MSSLKKKLLQLVHMPLLFVTSTDYCAKELNVNIWLSPWRKITLM